jgi:hypothetical protein
MLCFPVSNLCHLTHQLHFSLSLKLHFTKTQDYIATMVLEQHYPLSPSSLFHCVPLWADSDKKLSDVISKLSPSCILLLFTASWQPTHSDQYQ